MCFIKLLLRLSLFLLWIKVCLQQQMTMQQKKQLQGINQLLVVGGIVTDDPYDAEDKTNPTNLDVILNIDSGRYTTMLFNYHNQQNTYVTANYARETNDTCIDSYLVCLISQTTRTFVCATNDIRYKTHTFTFMSYCDMYFDNCRRGYRVWRVISMGYCYWKDSGEKRVYPFPTDRYVGDDEWNDRIKN